MDMKDVLIIVPARGGSKGIKNKNIYPVNGKPLIVYTLDVASKVDFDNDIAVSTDSKDIQDIVKSYEKVEIIRRPIELSGDTASTECALIHALDYMRDKYGKEYRYVMTLQPTSPLRKTETINNFFAEYIKNIGQFDAQLTLTEDRSDYWINEGGSYKRLFPHAPRRRQERKPIYQENSAIYITKSSVLKATNSVLGNNVNGYVISNEEGIDINSIEDIYYTEFLLNKKME